MLLEDICTEESTQAQLEHQILALQHRKKEIDSKIARKHETKTKLEATLREAEAAYSKILESSQTLLKVLKHESESIPKDC